MSFTPGPWAVLDKTAKRFTVKIIQPQIGTIATVNTPRSWDEAIANARLIAEAPAMYQLLDELRTQLVPGDHRLVRIEALMSRIGSSR